MTHVRSTPASAGVTAAVLMALYGLPQTATAQQQAGAQSETLTEVIVTASRRQQTTEQVPYSISVVNPTQLANAGVTDLASLARQVPGVSMSDRGARNSSTSFPIIRGLNASPGAAGFRTFEQAPVGTYIGNSPIDGYFQLSDIERVEVLRGPQGTLYGAGALGGALRIIPVAPKLGEFSGNAEVRMGTIYQAGDPSYGTSATINLPMGDKLAFRASANYEKLPGFIDAHGILKLDDNGAPALADPTDPVESSGIYLSKKDWNDQKSFTGRASLLWEPTDNFNAQLSYMYSYLEGQSGRVVTQSFPGGPFIGDPRIDFPAGGKYTRFAGAVEPYDRKTDMVSLDLSYDAGFATISSTSSYFSTDGTTQSESSYTLYRLPQYIGYYTGLPTSPRFIIPQIYGDRAHTFSQEVRLVSNTRPGNMFDYVVGLFYQKQSRLGTWIVTNPGSPDRARAAGCTGGYYFGAEFPNCIPLTAPGDVIIDQNDRQEFEDKSVFGELTWHFSDRGQLTAGFRHFKQDFSDRQYLELYAYDLTVPPEARTSPATKTTWKINPSYEYADNHRVYAVWSQGFRRGGSNALPLVGPFADNPELITYRPDTADNYELGLKGHFSNGLAYTLAAFKIIWDNPQIGGTTPTTNFAVWNAKKAESKGFELDINTPLGIPGLNLALSGAYADATFTEDYRIFSPFGDIVGFEGQQLPGSPKVSAAATLNYDFELSNGYRMAMSLNDTYRSKVLLSNFGILGNQALESEPMNIVNASVAVSNDSWLVGLYATNLTNERVLLSPGNLDPATNNLSTQTLINQPRELFVRVRYSF